MNDRQQNEYGEVPAETVKVTMTGLMSVLRPYEDETLEDAFKRELRDEMTPERALAFFEDAWSFDVESMETDETDN